MTTKINISTKFIYNNIDNLVLIDKYGINVPIVFNEFTGQVNHKFKSINIGKRILKKLILLIVIVKFNLTNWFIKLLQVLNTILILLIMKLILHK